MEIRRIAIYLGSRKPTAKVQLNHLYTSKIDKIIFKEGCLKTEIARRLLMISFKTDDMGELRERIYYAANVTEDILKDAPIAVKRRVAETCKNAIKRAIDLYQ